MKTKNEIIAEKILGSIGALISYSKSGYIIKHPNNLPVFNSCVCTEDEKIWFGDIDITLSSEKLIELSNNIEKNIYVLRESIGWEDPINYEKNVAKIINGELIINESKNY